MPELPEVETVRASLQEVLPGRCITKVDVRLPRLIKNVSAEHFAATLKNKKIINIERRGKYLRLCLDGQEALLVHLRMTGSLVYEPRRRKVLPRFAHVVFELDKGRLIYNDVRTLGCLWLIPATGMTGVEGYDSLGPDAINDDFTTEYLYARLHQKNQYVKAFLLDQTVVAGLGNIYVDEALFLAHIRPTRRCNRISRASAGRLHAAICQVLKIGLEHGGTTVRNFIDGHGREGQNQHFLNVYGREGTPCRECGTIIVYQKLAGRGTHFCPHCQK